MKQVPMLLPRRTAMRAPLILTDFLLSGIIKKNGDSLIKKGGQSFLSNMKEMAEFFRKLQERKGNLRKGGGNLVQLLYYSRVHSVVNDVNVIKASGTGVKAKGVNGYAQGQAPAAGGGKHDGDA